MPDNPPIYIMIGTRAQFIKMAPLMRELLDRGQPYTLLYTAQHQENINEVLAVYNLPYPDVVMYDAGEANTRSSFIRWFVSILKTAVFRAKKYIYPPGILLTHGDTFTAWLAAIMGKQAGCIVGHVESGCRSFNLLSPFPEEISRLITFHFSDIYFCADEWAINNLKRYPGLKINIGANTMLDGVRFALNYPSKNSYDFADSPFAIVSIHRFENIFTSRFNDVIIPILMDIAQDHRLVFTLHPTTRERLIALGLFDDLSAHPNIYLQERFGFVDWINLCNRAEFVITDGGSNQEELFYLGVPTLLFRNETERREGLEQNVVVSRFNRALIHDFINSLERYRKPFMHMDARPVQKIADFLSNYR